MAFVAWPGAGLSLPRARQQVSLFASPEHPSPRDSRSTMTTLATERAEDASLAFPTQHPSRSCAAVVGLGRAGHRARGGALDDSRVRRWSRCCDPDALGPTQPARARLRRARASTSVEALLARTHPEAVVICAPMTQRASAARRALEAGAAVLVDASDRARPWPRPGLWSISRRRSRCRSRALTRSPSSRCSSR